MIRSDCPATGWRREFTLEIFGGTSEKTGEGTAGESEAHGVRGLHGPTEVLGKQTTEEEKVARCTP